MSENGYSSGIQINTQIAGELVNLRAADGDEMAKLVKSVNDNADTIADALANAKQVFLGKSVMTGTVTPPATGQNAPPMVTNSAVPSTPPGGLPSCVHGVVTDLTGKPGKNGKLPKYRFYCPAPFNAPDKCRAEAIPGNQTQ